MSWKGPGKATRIKQYITSGNRLFANYFYMNTYCLFKYILLPPHDILFNTVLPLFLSCCFSFFFIYTITWALPCCDWILYYVKGSIKKKQINKIIIIIIIMFCRLDWRGTRGIFGPRTLVCSKAVLKIALNILNIIELTLH